MCANERPHLLLKENLKLPPFQARPLKWKDAEQEDGKRFSIMDNSLLLRPPEKKKKPTDKKTDSCRLSGRRRAIKVKDTVVPDQRWLCVLFINFLFTGTGGGHKGICQIVNHGEGRGEDKGQSSTIQWVITWSLLPFLRSCQSRRGYGQSFARFCWTWLRLCDCSCCCAQGDVVFCSVEVCAFLFFFSFRTWGRVNGRDLGWRLLEVLW